MTSNDPSPPREENRRASSVGFIKLPKSPEQNVLLSGAVILPGGKTISNLPLFIFPAKAHLRLNSGSISPEQLVELVKFHISLTALNRRLKGFAFVADFRASSVSVFSIIVAALTSLQASHTGVISVFFVLLPQNKQMLKPFYKVMGIYRKKRILNFLKKKEASVVANLPYKHLYSVMELRQFVTEENLTSDFAGTLVYQHQDWVHFYRMLEANSNAIKSMERKVSETAERLQDLQEIPLPAKENEAEETLGRMRSVYEDAISYLGLNEAIDETTHLLNICMAPERTAQFLGMAANPLWSDYRQILDAAMEQLLQRRLTMQVLYKMATDRVDHSVQMKSYKKQTGKAMQWIQDVGYPNIRLPLKIAKNLDEAEENRRAFMTEVYRPAKDAIATADKVVKKLDGLSHVVPVQEAVNPSHLSHDSARLVERFKADLENRKSNYEDIAAFFLSTGRLLRWYRRTLRNLPSSPPHILPLPPSSSTPISLPPEWHRSCRSYGLRHPPPTPDQLSRLKAALDLLPSSPLKTQARLLLHRLSLLVRLFNEKPELTAAQMTEILELRSREIRGLNKAGAGSLANLLDLRQRSPTSSEQPSTNFNSLLRQQPVQAQPPTDQVDAVKRFLRDQSHPPFASTDSVEEYSVPIGALEHFTLSRAQSEHVILEPRSSSTVPPASLYRPVSLGTLAGGSRSHLALAPSLEEMARQEEHLAREVKRRQELLDEADRSVRESSSFMEGLERSGGARPVPRARRGVRSVKRRSQPPHHGSAPNFQFDWDNSRSEEEEEEWDEDSRPLAELESLLNELCTEDPDPPKPEEDFELLPDTHIGSPPLLVRRYEGVNGGSSSGSAGFDRGQRRPQRPSTQPSKYPPFSQHRENVMMF